ncbi:MAG: hypothetical protein H7839_05020 [Magnetococcus sp. YQC-5]
MKSKIIYIFFIGEILFPSIALTAPLDEFLTATHGFEPWHGEGEVGMDVMNSSVDIFKMRENKTNVGGSSIGDYTGGHVRGGLALTRRLWVDGAAWSRKITTPYDKGESLTLQGGAQFQVTQPFGWFPAVALRMSAWRDSSSEAVKASPSSITMAGASTTADKIRVEQPYDEQVQLDLISTWQMSHNSTFSTFLSYGKSKVDFENLYVTNLKNVQVNSWKGNANGEFKVLMYEDGSKTGVQLTCMSANCSVSMGRENGDYLNATYPNSADLPRLPVTSSTVPEGLNIGYDANYYQLGGMYSWYTPQWRTRLGYRYMKLNRDLDPAVTQAGKALIDSNHFLSGEVGYKPPFKMFEHIGLFVRGQLMMNQFVGELPFTYNLFSAHKFDSRYGLVTFGVTGGF